MNKKKYHVYGDHYNWTYDEVEARRWAVEWHGVVTVEENGVEGEI